MKVKAIIIITILSIPFIVLGQKQKTPKNLKKAVFSLDKSTADSLKSLISKYGNDTIKEISYPWGGDFRIIFDWTNHNSRNSRIKKYLNKKGISHHQTEVILIAFRDFLNNERFDEKKILCPFQEIEVQWTKEDEVRYSTDSLRGNYIPKDLDDCFLQIDKFWHDSTKLKVKNWTEDEFSANAHFGFGLWMRNNWQLWGGSRLSKYFNDKEIFHPDDMSGIILDSYHRYLNKKELRLDEQLKSSKDYWKEVEKNRFQEEKEKLEKSKSYFDKYQIGDTLEFTYNFGFSTQAQEDRWMDDSCLARGILLEKKKEGLVLKVKVIQSCDKKGVVYYGNEDMRIYDEKKKRWTSPKKEIIKCIKKGKSRWFKLDDWELE